MNPIEGLRDELQQRFPLAVVHLTEPLRVADVWTLDVCYDQRWLIVDWTPPDRFAVSVVSARTQYGDGPDELFSGQAETMHRVEALLTTC